tara:strand:- start:5345 stop:7024 length:1680 start_codon:yes stop_codon:yes gene_type:complete
MTDDIPEKLKDFRNFLWATWAHLNLPSPTPIQYEIAKWMQNGPNRSVVQGFRGVGKSWICSAYVVHQLLLNPQKNILVVSASKTRADDFSTFTLRLIHEMPLLAHLIPGDKQRFSKISFDVGPAAASHAPSVKSLGITSQLTGSRADIIIADDVEVPNNSATQSMRDKLSEQVKEFEAILKPNDDSRIIFLGTPQCEDSIYNKLSERGYKTRIWTARFVAAPKNEKVYNGNVSALCVSGDNKGMPTEGSRFDDTDLAEREASYGKTGFAMQFMLDPKLSDLDRYPLKINDLIVMDLDKDTAPEKLVWAQVPENAWDSAVPNVGFTGDRFYRPMKVIGDHIPYTGSVLAIDPSGRGRDETSWAVVKMLNGYLYVPDAGGMQGGYDEKTLKALTIKAKENKVNAVVIESNFGDGMFSEILRPYLQKIYPVTIEEVRHNIQKEKRIVDTLEPVLNQHKLVMDPKVIKNDYESALKYPTESQLRYQLIFQLSRLTRDRGALTHDDRLDALSMGVAYWTTHMAQDAEEKIVARKDDLLQDELSKYADAYYNRTQGTPQTTSWIR